MPQEFRYPLTRYCLRGGALTLPRAMVGLFPETGEVTALDTKSETEYRLTVLDERTVTGLGPLFKHHRLAVNDELVIRALEDGRYSFTPVMRDHKPDYSSSDAQGHLLDELIAASVPVTEAEVRALYQGIPDDLDLAAVFAADERFVKSEGRWHNAVSIAYPLEPAPAAVTPQSKAVRSEVEVAVAAEQRGGAEAVAVGASPSSSAANAGAGASSARESAAAATSDLSASAAAATAGTSEPLQSGLWQGPTSGTSGGTSDADVASQPPPATVFERRQPGASSERFESPSRGRNTSTSTAADQLDDEDDEDGSGLEVTELANRLRAALAPCGFKLEAVARGQILLTADLGRKSYTVLAQLLTRSDRLDWADLLARRRALNVRYLAVLGDHRALLRLSNPAELARATMWSWQALDRMTTLQRTMSFSPIELESHFERDGLFEKGLERFEAAVAKRVAERGVVSELLTRLAVMRAPSVFLLEDLAGELKVPRDRLLKLLEMFSEAPFQLVSKVDHGEFVLRQRVADSLSNMAVYATSLRERLPTRQVEKLTATAEPDLLTGGEFDDSAFGNSAAADVDVDGSGGPAGRALDA